MELRKGDKGNIDFSSPIKLTSEQKERLVNFLRNKFYHVEVKEVTSFRAERLGADNAFNKEWEAEEFELLLKVDEGNREVSRKLGRTWMSVEMKRVSFIPEMMNYASKKGVDIYKTDIKKLVREYIKEHGEELTKKREAKKAESKKLKEEREEYESLRKEDFQALRKLAKISPDKIKIEDIENREKRLRELKAQFDAMPWQNLS